MLSLENKRLSKTEIEDIKKIVISLADTDHMVVDVLTDWLEDFNVYLPIEENMNFKKVFREEYPAFPKKLKKLLITAYITEIPQLQRLIKGRQPGRYYLSMFRKGDRYVPSLSFKTVGANRYIAAAAEGSKDFVIDFFNGEIDEEVQDIVTFKISEILGNG